MPKTGQSTSVQIADVGESACERVTAKNGADLLADRSEGGKS